MMVATVSEECGDEQVPIQSSHWLDQNSLFEILTIQTVRQWAIQLWIWILDEILVLHYNQLYFDFKATGEGSRLFIWVQLPLGHHQFSRHWGLPCCWSWWWWGCDADKIPRWCCWCWCWHYLCWIADNHQVFAHLPSLLTWISWWWLWWWYQADTAESAVLIVLTHW